MTPDNMKTLRELGARHASRGARCLNLTQFRQELLREGSLPAAVRGELSVGALSAPAQDAARSRFFWSTRPEPKGRVVLVPGIMASNLAVKNWLNLDDVIWVDFPDLISGYAKYLRLDNAGTGPGPGAKECFPDSVLTAIFFIYGIYSSTINTLERAGYEVVPFAYDWRKSVTSQAEVLREELRDQLEGDLPVSMVCHSMGGMLGTLAAFDDTDTDLGEQLAHVVIGATPFRGSFSAPNLFLGEHEFVKLLAGADLCQSRHETATMAATFPGVHDIMPQASLPLSGAAESRDPSNYARVRPKQAFLNDAEVSSLGGMAGATLEPLSRIEVQRGGAVKPEQ